MVWYKQSTPKDEPLIEGAVSDDVTEIADNTSDTTSGFWGFQKHSKAEPVYKPVIKEAGDDTAEYSPEVSSKGFWNQRKEGEQTADAVRDETLVIESDDSLEVSLTDTTLPNEKKLEDEDEGAKVASDEEGSGGGLCRINLNILYCLLCLLVIPFILFLALGLTIWRPLKGEFAWFVL